MNVETLNKRFSVERLALLIRNRIIDDSSPFAITTFAFFVLNLFSLAVKSPPFVNSVFGPDTGWPLLIGIGGILLASRAFAKMHDGRSGPDWLLLPATSTEKYLSAIISYLLVYPLIAGIMAFGLSALLAGIGNLVRSGGGYIWYPFALETLYGFKAYAIPVVIVLAGSARFRKYALLKTSAIGGGYIFLLTMIFVGISLIVSHHVHSFAFNLGTFNVHIDSSINLVPWKTNLLRIVANVFTWVTVLFSATYGFALVAEKEAKDEVQ